MFKPKSYVNIHIGIEGSNFQINRFYHGWADVPIEKIFSDSNPDVISLEQMRDMIEYLIDQKVREY